LRRKITSTHLTHLLKYPIFLRLTERLQGCKWCHPFGKQATDIGESLCEKFFLICKKALRQYNYMYLKAFVIIFRLIRGFGWRRRGALIQTLDKKVVSANKNDGLLAYL